MLSYFEISNEMGTLRRIDILYSFDDQGCTFERYQVSFKLRLHQNVACENDANVRCRRVTEARQTAFGCVTNVRQTAECYPSTVGT